MGEIGVGDVFGFFGFGFGLLLFGFLFWFLFVVVVALLSNTSFNPRPHNKTTIQLLNTRHLIINQLLIQPRLIQLPLLKLLIKALPDIGLFLRIIIIARHRILAWFSLAHMDGLKLGFVLF